MLLRRFALIHTPVELGRPTQLGIVSIDAWSEKLFHKYQLEVEQSRQRGGAYPYLSKRDIERWGFHPPCGPRVQVLELALEVEPKTHLK